MRVVAPYSLEVLNSVIYEYQSILFPMQFLFVVLGLLVVYLYWYQKRKSNQIISIILALFWFWSGFVYLGIYYEQINWFGSYASMVFCIQGALWLWYGFIKKALDFEKNLLSVLIALAVLILFPAFQLLMGVEFYEIYIVGMLPLATLAFSISVALSMESKKVLHVSLIPLFWSLFWLYWSYLLNNQPGLVLSGFCSVGIAWVLYKNFRNKVH